MTQTRWLVVSMLFLAGWLALASATLLTLDSLPAAFPANAPLAVVDGAEWRAK